MNSYIVTGAFGLPSVSPVWGIPLNSALVSATARSELVSELVEDEDLLSSPPHPAISATAVTATISARMAARTTLRRGPEACLGVSEGVFLADFELIARHSGSTGPGNAAHAPRGAMSFH